MGMYTFGKTPLNFHYPKINGIHWDYFNGKQWENLPRDSIHFLTSIVTILNNNYTNRYYLFLIVELLTVNSNF